jgi:hypothetical protein
VNYSLGSSEKFVPYVLGALGVGRQSLGLSASAGGSSASENLATSNSAYLGVGAGARIFVGDSWGFKPEFRYQRYTGSQGGNSAVFTVGLFYQFGK